MLKGVTSLEWRKLLVFPELKNNAFILVARRFVPNEI